MDNVIGVQGDSGLSQIPDKVLDLISIVLVPQQLDELTQPFFAKSDKTPAGVTEVRIIGVEDIRG